MSTSLSEFWAVGSGGCLPKDSFCSSARGGVYTPEKSSRWTSMGTWQLGLDFLGYGANGIYGLDFVESHSTISNSDLSMQNVLTAAVNSTDYFLGLFGLGITQGNFGNAVAQSPITQAVETFGLIPSYSYGYTAGAHYKNIPASVTLGGYDSARFTAHGNDFTLGASDNLPITLVRGIEVAANKDKGAPEQLDLQTTVLSDWSNSFTALIDSTTPFLWLPDSVCDNFAAALNLTYNSTLDLYTITNDQYKQYTEDESQNFVFSLSSSDNRNDFGDALNMPGVVNITLTLRALVGTLEYPFREEAIKYGEAAVPYVSLRRTGDNSIFIIGRSFLQEAYLLTQYDKRIFSIHQARFPHDSELDAEIVAIVQPSDSPFPPPLPSQGHSLSTGEIGGIAIGAIGACVLAVVAYWWRRRTTKLQSEKEAADSDVEKKSSLSITTEPAHRASPMTRFVSLFVRCKGRRADTSDENIECPSEVPNHEIFELPAPIAPAELDGNDDDGNEAELGLNDMQNASPYEQARMRLDRQLAGPVPEYTPTDYSHMPPPEKMIYGSGAHQSYCQDAPVSSPGLDSDLSNSISGPIPSPISPRGDWTGRYVEDPSPMSMTAPPFPSPIFTRRHHNDSISQDGGSLEPVVSNKSPSNGSSSPVTPSRIAFPLTPTFQRTPIDHSRVICLGPLPENVQVSHQGLIPQIVAPNGQVVTPPTFLPPEDLNEGSLGSNFTMEEESRLARLMLRVDQEQVQVPWQQDSEGTGNKNLRWSLQTEAASRNPAHSSGDLDSIAPRRRDIIEGSELVHVPQMADKRYSWEDDQP